jgi:signal transduction histidine kinase
VPSPTPCRTAACAGRTPPHAERGPTVTAVPIAAGAAGVRHDLRHGLAGLQALLQAVRSDPADTAAVLDAASTELRYVMGLVDVLPSSDAGAVPGSVPVTGGCDLADVLRAAARAAAWSDRLVTVDCPESLPVALAGPAASRVVRNLLGNALAAPAGTAVLLRARSVPGRGTAAANDVELEVHDDGRGPGAGDFSRPGGVGLDVVRSLVLGAGGWLCLGRSARGGVRAAVTLPSPAESGDRR